MNLRKLARLVARDHLELKLAQTLKSSADKWKSLPKGWTEDSRKKFWDSLTSGSPKHKVTKCIEKMDGKVDNPGAFCGSLSDRVDPGWRERTAAQPLRMLYDYDEPASTDQPHSQLPGKDTDS